MGSSVVAGLLLDFIFHCLLPLWWNSPYTNDPQRFGSYGPVESSFSVDHWGGEALLHALPESCACADRALLTYVARFLAGHRWMLVHGPGVGDPSLTG